MTASLTPALALAYLHELSVDVQAGVVLDAGGAALAGEAQLADRARTLLASAGTPLSSDGSLHVARTPDGGAIAVLTGSRVLMSLLEHDLSETAKGLVTASESGR